MDTKRPRLFERLKAGLEEGIQFANGERNLRVTEITIPDPPPQYSAQDVKAIRLSRGMSQALFSKLLNVSNKTLQGWEQGLRRPSQSAARLLQIIDNPQMLSGVSPRTENKEEDMRVAR
jgi:putative transcriptional regulator